MGSEAGMVTVRARAMSTGSGYRIRYSVGRIDWTHKQIAEHKGKFTVTLADSARKYKKDIKDRFGDKLVAIIG